jgi:hypothetical protein
MKKNLSPLLIGIAIASLTPIVALAQFPMPQAPPQQQQQQQSPIAQIEAQAMNEILDLLTPEQQSQYKRARRRGAGIIAGLDEVEKISEDQQKEIKGIIRRASRRIMDATAPRK